MKKKRSNTKIQRTGAKISFRDCFVQPAADLERSKDRESSAAGPRPDLSFVKKHFL